MDSLPQEILDNILGRIPARESDIRNDYLWELQNWTDVNSEEFDPETPRLRPDLAAVCRKFQLGIERATFHSLRITSDDLESVRDAFKRCPNRQTSLRELHVDIVTPEYRHSSGPSAIIENMAHCDIAHTEILRELMIMLSEWPDDTRVSLSISLTTYIKHNRQSKNIELYHFNFSFLHFSPRRNVDGDFLLMQKFPNLESFDLNAREFPFFIKPRREMRKSLINTLSSYQFPTSARHGKLIISPNEYGPFQQLPQMTKDGESDPLFVSLRRAIGGFSEFEYAGHLSSSFFWSPPPSLGDAVPYWQNMTKLKVDCDMVSPSGEWYLKHYNTRIVDGDDKVAVWTVNEKVMVPMLTSMAKAAGQMISLKELRFRVLLARYERGDDSEGFHRFHVNYLAPGVEPYVGVAEFPRCCCSSKDFVPEYRARQAGDLEKARLLLKIKTENLKREGLKDSCPDSPRWLLNMDQWQPNEELLDLFRQVGRKAHSKDAVIIRHVHHHRQDYILEQD
ncbi:hypothetical protein HER10_EVM0006268 [Colletotrichum scovillei]|uniref:uncharacterized protein n=1 Tax=Colletotrichum scovillei TaxID=1209932 RepID=UPI0015C3CD34|nr:uncharacterized protein HER10_EVM0006268 [Colletotrichum scovillei]KAF4785425.1 hypothetical protein HER10_EVM0006268 [Colletotrichum scovillei]